ncbi:MAG TPA: CotH kinase family protein [Candidatus Marinimicrobia bacterium]|jgi:hypothetical protein|nr:CotH kinase family protein [Candidatus Neomarinimicrobiota bacterium]
MYPKRSILVLYFIHLFLTDLILSQTHWETIIYADAYWRYFVGTVSPPENWNDIDFDDTGWQLGQGGFGYADGDDNTIIPNTVSVFFRVKFQVDDLNNFLGLVLHGDYDDGFVAYINGVEVARSTNMGPPGSFVTYNKTASIDHEANMYQGGTPEKFLINDTHLYQTLADGENVLAIEVHNVGISSSDMSGIFFLSVEIPIDISLYGVPPDWFSVPLEFTNSHLPIVFIDTYGTQIQSEEKITAHMGIIHNDSGELNNINDDFNHYDGYVGIEIRGSSTQHFPKKQFAVETRDSLGENNNVSLFGMPEENDWIFNAPYTDKSLMRNAIIYKMARDAGRYASRSQYFELVLNGEYNGLYVMLEKIKRDKNRVDIAKLNPDEVSGDDLTGGYIIKIDKWDGENLGGWYSDLIDYSNNRKEGFYQYHYPKPGDIVYQQKDYIQSYIDDFEKLMKSTDYANPVTGFSSMINWESFIDFFIMQEITKNIDGYRLSTYLHKDKDSNDGRLVAGPIWDFNLGFGNANYDEGWDTEGWIIDLTEHIWGEYDWINPFWWCLIWCDPAFHNGVAERWIELRENTLSDQYVNTLIDSLYNNIGIAAGRNFERWSTLGQYVWPNYFIGNTYEEEVEYLRDWILKRMNWMDNELLGSHTKMCLIPEKFGLNTVYPNPFNYFTSVQYSLPIGTYVKLDIFNSKGEHIREIYNGLDRPGQHIFNWNGKNKNGQPVSSGVYLISLEVNNFEYNYDKAFHQKVISLYKETKPVTFLK